jgi:hypothetical protein
MSHNARIVAALLKLDATEVAIRLARAYTKARGQRDLVQDWSDYATRHERAIRNWATREFTVFRDFAGMVNAHGNYTPTLRIDRNWQLLALANAYDDHQRRVGDPRRAERVLPAA